MFKFCACRKLENKNSRIQTGSSSLRDHAKVFPSAGQRLNIAGFSERLVEDLMLYRTEEGELKRGLSLFNIFFSSYAATRPLLRQIENLQNSYGNHTQTWERVERNLTDRLSKWKPNCIQNMLKGYIL